MAERKWQGYSDLGATPADGDTFLVLDISDTTDDAAGTVKEVTQAQVLAGHTHALSDITDADDGAAAALATQADAEAGTDNSDYMSPLRTFQAAAAWFSGLGGIGEFVIIDTEGNPLAVGALGGLSIGDSGLSLALTPSDIAAATYASQAEAEAGVENTKIMTSLRVAQAISEQASASGSSYNHVTDGADYSVTAFEIGTDGALKNEDLRLTNTTGTQIVNFGAGLGADGFGWIEPLDDTVTLNLTCPATVTLAGQTDRGGAASAVVVRGKTFWIRTASNVIELGPGGITEGTQQIHQNTDFNGADVSNVGALSLDATSGSIACIDKEVSRPELKDYSETSPTPSSSAGTLTLNLETGNVFESTLTENTTLAFSNPPASGKAGSVVLIANQDATGGRTLGFPASVEWADGSAPTMTSAANATDIFTFITRDAGTTWYGFVGGQAFS